MKNILRVIAFTLILIFTLSFVGCKDEGPKYSKELVQGKLEDVINVIQRGGHLHTEDYVPGMSEESFEPVYDEISKVVKNQTNIEIKLISDTQARDDDGNLFYSHEYEIKANGKSVSVVVIYGDGENTLHSISIK